MRMSQPRSRRSCSRDYLQRVRPKKACAGTACIFIVFSIGTVTYAQELVFVRYRAYRLGTPSFGCPELRRYGPRSACAVFISCLQPCLRMSELDFTQGEAVTWLSRRV